MYARKQSNRSTNTNGPTIHPSRTRHAERTHDRRSLSRIRMHVWLSESDAELRMVERGEGWTDFTPTDDGAFE